eukprot:3066716-Alexandrium_andersonii.AAC.1
MPGPEPRLAVGWPCSAPQPRRVSQAPPPPSGGYRGTTWRRRSPRASVGFHHAQGLRPRGAPG